MGALGTWGCALCIYPVPGAWDSRLDALVRGYFSLAFSVGFEILMHVCLGIRDGFKGTFPR